jgi:phosphate transport system substrate-binding protein
MKKHIDKMFCQNKSLISLTTLFSLSATAFTPLVISWTIRPVLAQSLGVSTSFPVPQSVKSGTKVQINSTTSMGNINQALAKRFKAKFPGTDVKIAYDSTDTSLKALPNGKIDLAAIGRSLTEAEKAQGLVSTPIARNKIAVIVGKDNSYKNSLTSEQVAKIFQGEINNWSQVGGSPQPIRLIDRPENSDLRQALQNYPVFKKAPFKTGANTVKLSADSTEAVIKELGTNGIGYAIADQVINNPNVQIVSLHKVFPTDPRYPFSQPLGYVYQKSNPSPAAKAFLGYATAPENQGIIEEARAGNATPTKPIVPKAVPEPIATPPAKTTLVPMAVRESRREFPFWLLLVPLLGVLGGLLWWLLNRRTPTSVSARVAAPEPVRIPEGRIILTPRNCRDVYAYWEVPNEVKLDLRRQGGRYLKVRVYDVTDIDMARQPPHSMKEFDCHEQAQDIHIPIAVDNRDYVAELGYFTNSDRWLKIARSAPVRVPACQLVGVTPVTATAGSLENNHPASIEGESRVILVPRNSKNAYVYWEVPEAHKAQLQRQGGRKLALRVYDTTGIDLQGQPARIFRQFECDQSTPDLHITIVQSDRDYVAELGYLTNDGRWLKLAHSAPVKVTYAMSVTKTGILQFG